MVQPSARWGSGKSVRKRPMRQMLSRSKRIVPRLEQLEDRLAPATYAWGGNDTALLVHLNTNESLSIASPAANTTTFTLSGPGTDVWTPTGTSASGGGDGTATITFNQVNDLALSIAIDNTGAAAGTNDVTFASGTISSGSISADTTKATGATGNILVDTATVQASGGTISLTASGTISDGATGTIQAANLALSAVTGIGASASPLNTTVGTLAALDATSGGVFDSNTGTLTIGSVGGLDGVTATGGAVTISTTLGLTVAKAVTANEAATLSGNGPINVDAAITGGMAKVNGGGGADTITVTTTGATPLALDGKGGGDSIFIDFGTLNAAVNVAESGGGANSVTVIGTAAAETLTVTAAQVSDTNGQTTTYSGVQELLVHGGNAGDAFNVQATGTPTILYGGTANDVFNLGGTVNSLDGITSAVTINGGGFNASPTITQSVTIGTPISTTLAVGDTVNVNDASGLAGATYILNGGSLARTGVGYITLNNIQTMNLNMSAGADTVGIEGTTSGTSTSIQGNGNDVFIVATTAANSDLNIQAVAPGSYTAVLATGVGSLVRITGNMVYNEFAGALTDLLTVFGTGANSGFSYTGVAGAAIVVVGATGIGSETVIDGSATVEDGIAFNSAYFVGNGSLLGVQGLVSIRANGASGLVLNDQNDNLGTPIYTLTTNEVDRSYTPGRILFSGLSYFTLHGAQMGDTFDVFSQPRSFDTSLIGGNNFDAFYVYVTATTDYQSFALDGGMGGNFLLVQDLSGGAAIQNYQTSASSGTVIVTYTSPPEAAPSVVLYQDITSVSTIPTDS